MDFSIKLQQLDGALEALSENWPKQNNNLDSVTRFIYHIEAYTDLIQSSDMCNLDGDIQKYAIHRWYNNMTSKVCEKIFAEYGAVSASREDDLNHTDLYINGIPFDIKVSVFPRKLVNQNKYLDLRKRSDKDTLIKWFYGNQSSEQRRCFNNRIFVVCNGRTVPENNSLKKSFKQMEVKIETYMNYLRSTDYDFNEVLIRSSDGEERMVKSDIITLCSESNDLKDRLQLSTCPACNSHYKLAVARSGVYKGNILMRCPYCNKIENV